MSWRKAPTGKITEHFTWGEAACNCCGRVPSLAAVRNTAVWAEKVRAHLGTPMRINSWVRCPSHNAAIGGEKGSFHLKGGAIDFTVKGETPHETRVKLNEIHGTLIGGLGRYPGFTHIDRGPKRDWEG